MIYHFILNPKSGRNRRHKNLDKIIKEACKKRHLDYHIYYTTCRGDATEYVSSMVRISQEKQRFICVGGDGSINEIVNSAPCNPNVEFGVIPRGSGNDFVRNFSNHKMFQDIDAQLLGDILLFQCVKGIFPGKGLGQHRPEENDVLSILSGIGQKPNAADQDVFAEGIVLNRWRQKSAPGTVFLPQEPVKNMLGAACQKVRYGRLCVGDTGQGNPCGTFQ